MRLSTLACCLCLAGGAVAADKPKTDRDKLQGTWEIVKAETSGMPLPDDVASNLKFVFKGDKLTVQGVPDVVRDYADVNFKLDETTKPKLVDIKILAGDQKGAEMEGIYEFKSDDEFHFCVQLVGKERPGDFATKEGDSRVNIVLKRLK